MQTLEAGIFFVVIITFTQLLLTIIVCCSIISSYACPEYETLLFCSKKNFLENLVHNQTLRAQRVTISTSIIELCSYRHIPLQQAVGLGIPIDQQDSMGRTFLMEVSRGYQEEQSCDLPLTQSLLDHKADPTLQDDEGRNAFGYALSSDHGARQTLLLAGHPKIAAIINEPMLIHGHRQTPLRAIIHASDAYCFYKKDIAKTILRAGARIFLENVIDSANQLSCCKAIFKKCSLDLLQQARLLLKDNPRAGYPLLSRQRALENGIMYQLREAKLKNVFPKPVYKLVKAYFPEDEKIDW